jgi:hypothetical protein
MKSHEALRGEREGADGLASGTAGRPAAPGHGSAEREAHAGRGASGGRRRPGSHGQEGGAAGRASRWPAWGRLSLRDWRVRSRLILLIAVPVLVAVVFGGLATYSSLRTAESYQQVQQLAVLAGDATNLAQALQNEREDTVTFIAMANAGGRASALARDSSADPELALLKADYSATDRAAARVTSLAGTIGSSYPGLAQTQAQGAIAQAALYCKLG